MALSAVVVLMTIVAFSALDYLHERELPASVHALVDSPPVAGETSAPVHDHTAFLARTDRGMRELFAMHVVHLAVTLLVLLVALNLAFARIVVRPIRRSCRRGRAGSFPGSRETWTPAPIGMWCVRQPGANWRPGCRRSASVSTASSTEHFRRFELTHSHDDERQSADMTVDEPTTAAEASPVEAASRAAIEEITRADARSPFGPRFFLQQLAAFVLDRCPDPAERLPQVDLWVHGEPITVCHVMAVAPHWVAMAARTEREQAEMRTELIVYASIGRVTISGTAPGPRAIGFDTSRQPAVIDDGDMSPEEALAAAARILSREEDG